MTAVFGKSQHLSIGICQIDLGKRKQIEWCMEKNPITQRIKALMDERSLTRAELGRATGIPYHRLNPWFVRPAARPNAADIETLASYFGVSTGHILNGDERQSSDAREYILSVYDRLPPKERQQLEGFAEFLQNQLHSQGKKQG